MRFTRSNWKKFFDGSNKQTTIRLKISRIGHNKAYEPSFFIPVLLGEFDIKKIIRKPYGSLTEEDSILDGFKTLAELKAELERLYGKLLPETIIFQHWISNAKKEIMI